VTVGRLIDAFGRDRLFVELQRHHLPDEERAVEGLIELAQAHRLPLVATNGVVYAEPIGRHALDVFTCIRNHTHLDAAGLFLELNSQRHLKKPQQMEALFADLPEALLNTERIAERLEFSLSDLGYEFPRFPVSTGETMDGQLRKLTYFGAQQRYGSINTVSNGTPPYMKLGSTIYIRFTRP
jgi:error-prone DNA polymerase